jgi:creatinine amidohydrolase/Fe(II)-dependent formamide hydrolase-like protein
MGDPAAATAENGKKWVNEAAAKIAEILVAMYHFVPRHDA